MYLLWVYQWKVRSTATFSVSVLLFASPASCQILELVEEPRRFPPELHEVHHQFALPPVPLHRGLCLTGHAALRRTVSERTDCLFPPPSSEILPLCHTDPPICSSVYLPSSSSSLRCLICGDGGRHVGAAGRWLSSSSLNITPSRSSMSSNGRNTSWSQSGSR